MTYIGKVRHVFACLAFSCVLLGCAANTPTPIPPPKSDTALRIASHNVHFIRLDRATGPWSRADWDRRKGALDATFKALDADIIAFQEMVSITDGPDRSLNLARDALLARNPEYGVAGSGDWWVFPTRQPIFYRKDHISVLDQGWFYFDDPAEVAREQHLKEFWIYYCSWATFRDASGRVFHVYNVHFHYSDPDKREQAARILTDKIAPILKRGDPIFVVGDTNALEDGRTVQTLRKAGLKILETVGATFHFNAGLGLYGAIDRIGTTPQIQQLGGLWIVRQQYGGGWPSDHYPVVADFRLP
ncbi:endonuclease/exonuclease/phosphatase family protein [uncultured Pelagimonas sp.]|uniref:endonuclease/exonuclease/phosphatase family protein n=1 Tax=uncultured Pelagimonas sp. TaxID=1618102 RepID=UPI0026094339|nr:endonuclease/exonuclease/phosphatase family protein [uncultured Pelagimonas sp.]